MWSVNHALGEDSGDALADVLAVVDVAAADSDDGDCGLGDGVETITYDCEAQHCGKTERDFPWKRLR